MKKTFFFPLLILHLIASAQNAADLDLSFNPGAGISGRLEVVALQGDKILIGGNFTQFNGDSVQRGIARLLPNGQLDNSFKRTGSGFNAVGVFAFAVQPDKKIIVVGDFTSYDGGNMAGVVRLLENGELDPDFNRNGTGFKLTPAANNPILAVALLQNSKILVGGRFSSYNGTPCRFVVRLKDNGTLDSSFTVSGVTGTSVRAIAVQPDNKIIIGGNFVAGGAQPASQSINIARLNANGSFDGTLFRFPGQSPADTLETRALALQGTDIIAGHELGVSRYDALGSRTDFFAVSGGSSNSPVTSIAIQANLKIIAVGSFTIPTNGIFRLNADFTADASFAVNNGFSPNPLPHSVVLQCDGKIVVGRRFEAYNGVNRKTVARLKGDFNPNAVTVNAGVLSGNPSSICVGGTTTYSSNGDAGGTFSISNPSVAAVNSSTGIITGVSAGTATITYTVTGCGTSTATKLVTVNPNANAGTISGTPSTICVGGTTDYNSSGDAGGTFSSSNLSIAAVNSATGVVTGVSAGTVTITYTITGCGTSTATKSVTVSPNASAGTISGTPSTICIGGTTDYNSSGDGGGTFSGSNNSIASVNATTGVITGVSAGTATITYTVTGCGTNLTATKPVTVNPNANAGTISGTPSTICIGETTDYNSSGDAGGIFSSSNNSIASVNATTGVITGVSAGTATITYTVTGCGTNLTATKTVTVKPNANAGTVSGTPSTICVGGTTDYNSSGDAGGTFSSSNPSVASVNPTTGVITGVSAGTATITYTVTGCGTNLTATKPVTVNPNANAGTISGTPSTICIGETTDYNSSGDAGGTFSSSNNSIASVNATTGVITGISAGTATITYTVTGCGTNLTSPPKSVTVNPNANAGKLSGNPSTICIGETTTYSSDGDAGGTFSSSNPSVATVEPSTGVVTGVSAGTATITYTVTNCGTSTATIPVKVKPDVNAGIISGRTPLCYNRNNSTIYTSSGDAGGTFNSSNPNVATVDPVTGRVTALSIGHTDITYTVTGCNGPKTSSKRLNVRWCQTITPVFTDCHIVETTGGRFEPRATASFKIVCDLAADGLCPEFYDACRNCISNLCLKDELPPDFYSRMPMRVSLIAATDLKKEVRVLSASKAVGKNIVLPVPEKFELQKDEKLFLRFEMNKKPKKNAIEIVWHYDKKYN